MIKERYCSYEVSKLLREKGFDESIHEFYDSSGTIILYASNKEGFRLSELNGVYYPHITHQMAIDWLREIYNILIWLFPVIPVPIPKDETVFHWEWKAKKKLHRYPNVNKHIKYETYEEVVEAALKYCITKLI